MKISEQGRGLVLLLILVVLAAVAVILFMSKGNLGNNSSSNVEPRAVVNTPTATTQSQPQGAGTMMLKPADVTTSVNQTFTIDVNVDPKADTVSAVELHLKFDQNYLEATAIKNGMLLPVVLALGKVTPGSASIALGANPTALQKGPGTIATVTFKAKKVGKTQVTIDKSTILAEIGRSGNVLSAITGTNVTIK